MVWRTGCSRRIPKQRHCDFCALCLHRSLVVHRRLMVFTGIVSVEELFGLMFAGPVEARLYMTD